MITIDYLILFIEAICVGAVIGLIIGSITYWIEYLAIKPDEHENESIG